MAHYPEDLKTLVNDRAFDQSAHWLHLIQENPTWRNEFEQTAFQTTDRKTVYIIRLREKTKSATNYYVRPDVVDLFKNNPDVMYRELRRLAKEAHLPVMPNQAHPTSAHTLSLAYDNERLVADGQPKKWEFRQYEVGRSSYSGIGYEVDGKFLIMQSDGQVSDTIHIAHAVRQ
jgi:hypothetical protein